MILTLGWAALGWLAGTGLELAALRLSGSAEPRCAQCGGLEPGQRYFALARAFGPAGPRCRSCGAWGIVWLAGLGPLLGLVFGLIAQRWSFGLGLLVVSLYTTTLALVAAVDLRHRLVFGLLTYPATIAAAVLTPLALGQPLWSGLAGALVAAGVLLFFYLLARVFYRRLEALGFGDVMIAGLVGAMVGLPLVREALLIGVLLGGVNGLLVMLVRRSRYVHFAYGPALCLGALLVLLAGPAS